MNAGNWGIAGRDFDLAIDLDSRYAAAYFHRAQSYRQRSDIRKLIADDESIAIAYRYDMNALLDLLKAVELDDSVPDYHALLGYTYARLDKGKDALKAINRAVELFDQGKKLQYAPKRYLRVDESRVRDDRKRLNELYRKDT